MGTVASRNDPDVDPNLDPLQQDHIIPDAVQELRHQVVGRGNGEQAAEFDATVKPVEDALKKVWSTALGRGQRHAIALDFQMALLGHTRRRLSDLERLGPEGTEWKADPRATTISVINTPFWEESLDSFVQPCYIVESFVRHIIATIGRLYSDKRRDAHYPQAHDRHAHAIVWCQDATDFVSGGWETWETDDQKTGSRDYEFGIRFEVAEKFMGLLRYMAQNNDGTLPPLDDPVSRETSSIFGGGRFRQLYSDYLKSQGREEHPRKPKLSREARHARIRAAHGLPQKKDRSRSPPRDDGSNSGTRTLTYRSVSHPLVDQSLSPRQIAIYGRQAL